MLARWCAEEFRCTAAPEHGAGKLGRSTDCDRHCDGGANSARTAFAAATAFSATRSVVAVVTSFLAMAAEAHTVAFATDAAIVEIAALCTCRHGGRRSKEWHSDRARHYQWHLT